MASSIVWRIIGATCIGEVPPATTQHLLTPPHNSCFSHMRAAQCSECFLCSLRNGSLTAAAGTVHATKLFSLQKLHLLFTSIFNCV